MKSIKIINNTRKHVYYYMDNSDIEHPILWIDNAETWDIDKKEHSSKAVKLIRTCGDDYKEDVGNAFFHGDQLELY